MLVRAGKASFAQRDGLLLLGLQKEKILRFHAGGKNIVGIAQLGLVGRVQAFLALLRVEPVDALLQGLADTDEALNTLRMEHLALIEAGKQTEAAAQDAEAAVPAEAEPAEEAPQPAEAEAEAQASDPDEDEPDGPAPIDLLTGAPAEDLRPVEEVTDSVAEDPKEPKPEQ